MADTSPPPRRSRLRPALWLGVLGACLMYWSGCIFFATPPCLTPQDCPGQVRCIAGKCLVAGSEKGATDSGLDKDAAAPTERSLADPRQGPDNSGPDAKQPDSPKPEPRQNFEQPPEGRSSEPGAEPQPREQGPEPRQACTPGQTQSCYSGPAGTEGKGSCQKGTQSCEASGNWGPCTQELLPQAEICDGKDNDCDGSIDEEFADKGKACKDLSKKGACQTGTTTCESGKVSCVSKTQAKAEVCGNNVDDDCDGQTDENPPCACKAGEKRPCGSDTGECKKGSQTCDAKGQWGACTGEVKGTKEVCNGKDDDCDGQTDEDFANVGQSCAAGRGQCNRQGKLICQADGTVGCDAKPGAPAAEVCDGKDNDCDGKIDNGNNLASISCKTGQLGICSEGNTRCSSDSALRCVQKENARTEICRNLKDDDCDGVVDDICGPALAFAVVTSTGSFVQRIDHSQAQRGFSAISRPSQGQYLLTIAPQGPNCSKHVAFVSPHGLRLRLAGVECKGNNYEVRVSETITSNSHKSPKAGDGPFSLVIPDATDAWALIEGGKCTVQSCSFKRQGTFPTGTTMRRTGNGKFVLKSSLCSVSGAPLFAQIWSSSFRGHTIVSVDPPNNECTFELFDLKGDPTNEEFAIWLPAPGKHAWISFTASGVVFPTLRNIASNDFNDSRARWSLNSKNFSASQCPGTSTGCRRVQVSFDAWANPSALLVSRRSAGYSDHASMLGFDNGDIVIGGHRFTNGNILISLFGTNSTAATVLFVQ